MTEKLSKAQRTIVDRIQAGAGLSLNSATGLYALSENGETVKVDQRPVEAMILAGVLVRDMTGRCSLVNVPFGEKEKKQPAFEQGCAVKWNRAKRGAFIGIESAVVVSATSKQVRIKLSSGEFHVVRPDALSRG